MEGILLINNVLMGGLNSAMWYKFSVRKTFNCLLFKCNMVVLLYICLCAGKHSFQILSAYFKVE
jgi:hypothetical protein